MSFRCISWDIARRAGILVAFNSLRRNCGLRWPGQAPPRLHCVVFSSSPSALTLSSPSFPLLPNQAYLQPPNLDDTNTTMPAAAPAAAVPHFTMLLLSSVDRFPTTHSWPDRRSCLCDLPPRTPNRDLTTRSLPAPRLSRVLKLPRFFEVEASHLGHRCTSPTDQQIRCTHKSCTSLGELGEISCLPEDSPLLIATTYKSRPLGNLFPKPVYIRKPVLVSGFGLGISIFTWSTSYLPNNRKFSLRSPGPLCRTPCISPH